MTPELEPRSGARRTGTIIAFAAVVALSVSAGGPIVAQVSPPDGIK